VAAQRHHPVDHGGGEQRLVHGQATTRTPHLGGAGVAGSAFQPSLASEIQQWTPRRRSRSPSMAEAGQAAWGLAQRGVERRRRRQTEAKQTDPHGQKRERKEAERLPHTAMAETTRIERRCRQRLAVARERERLGLGFDAGERASERGAQPAGPGWSGLTQSVWSDEWAQAISQFCFFKRITKNPRKTLNRLKQQQKNI
jgi:hypothetical protein